MKKLVLISLLIFPQFLFAQKVITLAVNQPPEFGFAVSKQDTTIIKGSSVVLGTDIIIFGGSGEYKYSWAPAEALDDSTLINPMATPLDTTTYVLSVTDEFGCSFSLDYTVNVRNPIVGIDIIPNHSSLHAILFPNPNKGKFKVQITGSPSQKIEWTIFDNNGKAVKKQTVKNFTGEHSEMIQVSLVNGIYFLKIESDTEALTHQFVIN